MNPLAFARVPAVPKAGTNKDLQGDKGDKSHRDIIRLTTPGEGITLVGQQLL